MSCLDDCVFCRPCADQVFLRNDLAFALWDSHPVTPLHALIIPVRHVEDYFGLRPAELLACDDLLRQARDQLLKDDPTVIGFNIGVNVGVAGGQTIFHCHFHLIPRRAGDVDRPRGGIRQVISRKG